MRFSPGDIVKLKSSNYLLSRTENDHFLYHSSLDGNAIALVLNSFSCSLERPNLVGVTCYHLVIVDGKVGWIVVYTWDMKLNEEGQGISSLTGAR